MAVLAQREPRLRSVEDVIKAERASAKLVSAQIHSSPQTVIKYSDFLSNCLYSSMRIRHDPSLKVGMAVGKNGDDSSQIDCPFNEYVDEAWPALGWRRSLSEHHFLRCPFMDLHVEAGRQA